MKRRLLLLLTLFAPLAALHAEDAKPTEKKPEETKAAVSDIKVVIHTDKGDIEATIFASKVPMTSANFLNLAKRGYYNGVAFHRVIEDFMIQGGDPTGTGTGGPGYKFDNETDPSLSHSKEGAISMANAGPNTNGSQFFITMSPQTRLDGGYSLFGQVTKGMDVVKSIVGKNPGREPGTKADGKGDKIKTIEIVNSTDALFAAQKANLDKWNKIMDAKAKDK